MFPFLGDPMGTPKAKIKLKILKILKNVKIQQKMEVFKPKSTKKAEIYQILSWKSTLSIEWMFYF